MKVTLCILGIDDRYPEFKGVHPYNIIKDLGISFNSCEPCTIADCWFFYGCDDIPDEIPDFIEVEDV